jgi:hypothetical protein
MIVFLDFAISICVFTAVNRCAGGNKSQETCGALLLSMKQEQRSF